MKTHGDPNWKWLPTYLDVLIPRVLEFLKERRLTITFFIVGQDASMREHHGLLGSLAEAGHEIGNHSFQHEPWLHLYSLAQMETEIEQAEEHITEATGQRPIGFRGPGFSLSATVVQVLIKRGYLYDASTLPTYLGPLARAYYFRTAKLTEEQRNERKKLFGSWREGLRSLHPYLWEGAERRLLEIPVTTMPGLRVPFHLSYLLYLSTYSDTLALTYFRTALTMCRLAKVEPSLLLHPLDFLGPEDAPELAFFPAMKKSSAAKTEFAGKVLNLLSSTYRPVTMREHALSALQRPGLRLSSFEAKHQWA
jgi:hypothetical protein